MAGGGSTTADRAECMSPDRGQGKVFSEADLASELVFEDAEVAARVKVQEGGFIVATREQLIKAKMELQLVRV